MRLVEINRGLWVRPEQVTMVVALRPSEDGRPFTVRITTAGEKTTGWEFKTWDDAQAFADKLAAAVNAALPPPPYPQMQVPSMWYPQSFEARSNMQPLANAQNAQTTRTDPTTS